MPAMNDEESFNTIPTGRKISWQRTATPVFVQFLH